MEFGSSVWGWRIKKGSILCLIFFFQAEDGIRDTSVTGVQTCALPIFFLKDPRTKRPRLWMSPRCYWLAQEMEALYRYHQERSPDDPRADKEDPIEKHNRSEERRVGKECRPRRWTQH